VRRSRQVRLPWKLKTAFKEVMLRCLKICGFLLCAFTLVAALNFGRLEARPSAAPDTPTYEVYAIRFATLVGYPVSQLVAGAEPSRKMDLAMIVWLVRGNGHVILVDSGFYRDKFFHDDRFHIVDFVKPTEALARMGIKPEDVTDLIVTHMHWDHADGLDLFPKARIWIQKDEYNYYVGEGWTSSDKHVGVDQDDVLALVKLNLAGRVSLIPGDNQEIFPGVTCYTGGRHTFASQYVGVKAGKSTIVLASDNVYVEENLKKRAPVTATFDSKSNLQAQDRMRQIASEERLIITGHDPVVFTEFPSVANGVVRIE
jgi:glyoxylase-like metal-dependent hydrolase (beta-lactamase superfamily II)